jgi:hypothetical protein
MLMFSAESRRNSRVIDRGAPMHQTSFSVGDSYGLAFCLLLQMCIRGAGEATGPSIRCEALR